MLYLVIAVIVIAVRALLRVGPHVGRKVWMSVFHTFIDHGHGHPGARLLAGEAGVDETGDLVDMEGVGQRRDDLSGHLRASARFAQGRDGRSSSPGQADARTTPGTMPARERLRSTRPPWAGSARDGRDDGSVEPCHDAGRRVARRDNGPTGQATGSRGTRTVCRRRTATTPARWWPAGGPKAARRPGTRGNRPFSPC